MQLTVSPVVTRAPFRIQSLLGDGVPHASWRQASKDALAALRQGESVVVLGLAGTGKTLLLDSLGQALRREGRRVRSLGMPRELEPGTPADVLLVDEADRLPNRVLDELLGRGGVAILAGLPNFAARLERHKPSVATVKLEPLSPEDVARFVAVRLSAAGQRRDLFEPDAVLALARRSAGLPRLVIVLAGAAMFLAEDEGAEHVSARHVEEAAAMREVGQGDRAVHPDAAPPASDATGFKVAPTFSGVVSEPRMIRFTRTKHVALGLGGLVLLLAVGWMLSGRHPSSTPALPQREDALSLSPATAPLPFAVSANPPVAQLPVSRPPGVSGPADPVVPSAPVRLPNAGAAPASSSSAQPGRAFAPASIGPNETVVAFQGPILNETMNQQGQLSLSVRRWGATNVTASFRATAGLIGSGDLTGTLTADGHIAVSGRLMMSRNPFDATLVATIVGDKLKGTATFVRPEAGSMARSSFSLSRF